MGGISRRTRSIKEGIGGAAVRLLRSNPDQRHILIGYQRGLVSWHQCRYTPEGAGRTARRWLPWAPTGEGG